MSSNRKARPMIFNVLNCVFKADDPNFSDISDVEVEHIEGGGK